MENLIAKKAVRKVSAKVMMSTKVLRAVAGSGRLNAHGAIELLAEDIDVRHGDMEDYALSRIRSHGLPDAASPQADAWSDPLRARLTGVFDECLNLRRPRRACFHSVSFPTSRSRR
jgi:hypothetical protein